MADDAPPPVPTHPERYRVCAWCRHESPIDASCCEGCGAACEDDVGWGEGADDHASSWPEWESDLDDDCDAAVPSRPRRLTLTLHDLIGVMVFVGVALTAVLIIAAREASERHAPDAAFYLWVGVAWSAAITGFLIFDYLRR